MLVRLSFKLRLTLALLVLATSAMAQSRLTVTANVVGSTLLTLDNAGRTFSGAGTATVNALSTLSSTIHYRALKANLVNTSYTLVAQLQHALPSGVTWKVNGVTLSTSPAAVTTASFGDSDSLSWEIAATTPLDNAIIFTVVPK